MRHLVGRWGSTSGLAVARQILRGPARACRITLQVVEVRAELTHRAVEMPDVAMRARLHHATLHGGQHELGEFMPVERCRKAVAGRDETAFDGGRPRVEV